MRKLVIKKILDMNEKLNKLNFGETRPIQEYLLSYATDEFLLSSYELLIRFDEEFCIKSYLNTGKLPSI